MIDADGNLYIGRKALRDAIYATRNFKGITDNLSCDANGDCADPTISIKRIQVGSYMYVWHGK